MVGLGDFRAEDRNIGISLGLLSEACFGILLVSHSIVLNTSCESCIDAILAYVLLFMPITIAGLMTLSGETVSDQFLAFGVTCASLIGKDASINL